MIKKTKEELEAMSYQDIAELILDTKRTGETTISLFTEICQMLNMSQAELEDKIGDFYTGLTIDKRFLILNDGKWDLKVNHSVEVVVEDEEDDITEDLDEEADELEEVVEDDIDIQSDDDFEEDELEDLVVVNVEDLNEN